MSAFPHGLLKGKIHILFYCVFLRKTIFWPKVTAQEIIGRMNPESYYTYLEKDYAYKTFIAWAWDKRNRKAELVCPLYADS